MQDDPIYIFGHKNPDPDAICSAIAYSAYKQAIGEQGFVPARCGNTNARIDAVLDHFKVPLPVFIGDVTPKVTDVMVPIAETRKVNVNATCMEALELIDVHDVRALPVIDSGGILQGMLSIFTLGEYFIPKVNNPKQMRVVRTDINSIIRSVKGRVLNVVDGDKVEDLFVRVAAMSEEYFGKLTEKEGLVPEKSVIVVGDRKEIHAKAIKQGVRMLVVSWDWEVSPEIVQAAKEKNVSIVVSPYDTATTASIIRSAVHIKPFISNEIVKFDEEDKLSKVKRAVATSNQPLYFVVNKQDRLLGVLSKSDILKPIKKKIVLVDHNELSQAVEGAGEINITEIIDHHRLGNPPTQLPIRFINEPLGSTCTIVAKLFKQQGLKPSKEIAGVMMGGIISDTLNLNGPTTTDVDREILPWLSGIAGISADDLAQKMFNSGSVILSMSPEEVVEADAKIYSEGDINFSVAQVEELGFDNFWKNETALSEALAKYRQTNELDCSFLFVTDINTQDSLLVVKGGKDIIDSITFSSTQTDHIFKLPGIVSRKKQLIPYITSLYQTQQA